METKKIRCQAVEREMQTDHFRSNLKKKEQQQRQKYHSFSTLVGYLVTVQLHSNDLLFTSSAKSKKKRKNFLVTKIFFVPWIKHL